MRILVITSDVPFVDGGHRVFARAVCRGLLERGHEAEMMTTPTNRFGRQISAYLANRLHDVELTGDGLRVDAVVSLRYPAFVVPHPHHRMWLTHLLREYYDLWPPFRASLSLPRALKERVRRGLLKRWDASALAGLERRFVISRTVKERLERYLGVTSEVLYPPPQERPYRCDGDDGFVLAPSRLHPLKRQDLLLEALARLPGTRAVVVGTGSDGPRLQALAERLGVSSRVTFAGYVSDDELCRLYATCRAVYFAPRDEDYGFITLEAFRSRKPVLTCTDSGGPTELVVHGGGGMVVAPEAGAVADGLGAILQDPAKARRLGEGGHDATSFITWPRAIEALLS